MQALWIVIFTILILGKIIIYIVMLQIIVCSIFLMRYLKCIHVEHNICVSLLNSYFFTVLKNKKKYIYKL